MKNISKKVLAGTLAATFVLGLGYVGLNQAQVFAASDTGSSANSASAQAQTQDGKHGHSGLGFRGMDTMKEAASILGLDQAAMMDSLKSGGKSLADLASEKGLSEDDFLAKLNAAVTGAIDAKVAAGTLTQDQAAQLKSGLADHLKQQVENKDGFGRGGDHNGMTDGGKGGGHGRDGFGGMLNADTLTGTLGMTREEIRAELDSGKTLAEIAQAKGISEEDLISKLKDGMTEKIKQFVEAKHQKPAHSKDASGRTGLESTSTPAPAVSQ